MMTYPNNPALKQTAFGAWVLVNDNLLSRWIEDAGRLDFHQGFTCEVCKYIKSGDTVVDVGAFVGDHTLAYARAVGPTGKVIAFEPNPVTCEALCRNMAAMPWVECHMVALSDAPGEGSMHQDPNAGASTVVEGSDVIIATLDDFEIPRCALIKTDAEGMDLRVLQGAEATIMRCRPVLVMEVAGFALEKYGCTEKGLLEWLTAHRYRFDRQYEGQPVYDLFAFPL